MKCQAVDSEEEVTSMYCMFDLFSRKSTYIDKIASRLEPVVLQKKYQNLLDIKICDL